MTREELLCQVFAWLAATHCPEEVRTLNLCTNEQLESLCNNFIAKGSSIRLYSCNPQDHLALDLLGMYVGIEPDGYTHT